ncbi:MAG TPA: alpha/beta hydrolase [Thermoleophilaceae bacterium]|nr:alpha/beta hydrolase [Thermoleophilaceae bacterium]
MNSISTSDGMRLAFDDVGEGPPVILTHGWVVGGEMWEAVAARLAAGHRAVSVDRRGCGRSDRPSHGFDLDTLADDLRAFLDALDVREATLVAHSVGGAEAVRMLARHGAGRIARLVLVGTTTPGPPQEAQPNADTLDELVGGMLHDQPAYVRAGVPGFFGDTDAVSPELADWAVGLTLRASLAASIGIMSTGASTDTSADVAACPVPTLLLHGDADASAPLELTGRPTAEALPEARLELYAGAAHGLPLTHPERIAADIRSFVIPANAAALAGGR